MVMHLKYHLAFLMVLEVAFELKRDVLCLDRVHQTLRYTVVPFKIWVFFF